MYDAFDDPYCYPGSDVLRNRLGLTDAVDLEAFETEITAARAAEPLPNGRFGVAHYQAIHRHLFQDVYAWAGKFRTVRLAKGGNSFCYPEYIKPEMDKLFAQLRSDDWLRNRDSERFIEGAVRRQNIWRRSRRKLVESGPRLGIDIRRRAFGAASADIGWSVV